MPDFARISLIEASPHNAGAAYVAVKNYQNDDRKPYIFKTDDYGKTWTKIVNGIPDDDFVHAVREDPASAGLLFAGTEHGIYVSFDDGAQWQSLSLNLPDTQVSDIVIEGNDLVIATHGRSFYVLDDIAPLRQLTPAMLTEDVHLFQPPDGRAQRRRGAHRLLPRASPPTRSPIDILDAKGQVVRTFTGSPEDQAGGRGGRGGRGAAPALPQPASRLTEGARRRWRRWRRTRRGGAPPVPRKAGLNHFTWDMRYPGRQDLRGHDPVERQHAGSGGRARHLPGAPHRQRQDPHREVRARKGSAPRQRDHRRSHRAVHARHASPRQDSPRPTKW